ncbi:hypothetical protein BUALT_Bualt03G0119100 [Buddleja alternifolia]|uniref:Uncharacterized protein n=1 Tax=Buddleja alternifolia TaxID=168488 RepID=A0AAV6Y0D6_9LAMI|nr:hypothetical protein BUALT_Bualt03G0119100 [Buddleja alternifolia]
MVYQCSNLVAAQSRPVVLQSHYPRFRRGLVPSKEISNCCDEQPPMSIEFGAKQAIAGLAASVILLSQTNLVSALSYTYVVSLLRQSKTCILGFVYIILLSEDNARDLHLALWEQIIKPYSSKLNCNFSSF